MRAKKLIGYIAVAAIWLAVWQCIYLAVDKPVLLASPMQTATNLFALLQTSQLWLSVAGSVVRVAAGFITGVVAGSLIAVLTYASSFMAMLFKPLMAAVKAAPVASFIILAFIWLPVTVVPVFTSFLIVAPLFWSNMFCAIGETDSELLEMAYAYKMRPYAKLKNIYVPSVMPSFISSVTTGIGMAWKAGVAAEVICRCKNSLGGGLYSAKIALQTDGVFAWTLTVIILSLLIEKLAVKLINLVYSQNRRIDRVKA